MVFRNRTALERREASCPECGHETTLAAAGADHPDTPEPRESRPRRRRIPELDDAPVTGTAFIAGLALGALVAHLIQRR